MFANDKSTISFLIDTVTSSGIIILVVLESGIPLSHADVEVQLPPNAVVVDCDYNLIVKIHSIPTNTYLIKLLFIVLIINKV